MTDMMKRLADLPEERRAKFLAQLRAQVEGVATRGPQPRRDTGPAPLSYAQEGLWFLDRLAPGRTTYNVPFFYRMRGKLDVDALRGAFAQVVSRHQALRTAIVERQDGPVQVIADHLPVELPVIDVEGDTEEERRAGVARMIDAEIAAPFDLGRHPLWRVYLLRTGPEDHVLVFNVHHIVFDGWSLGLMTSDMVALYTEAVTGEPANLPDMAIQYPDYCVWQREWLSGKMDELASYWRDRLTGVPTVEFPTDRPRPAVVSFDGALVHANFDPASLQRARALAREEGVTHFTVCLAAFFVFLQRVAGADDLIALTPNANRRYASVDSVIGYFIALVPVRADLSGNPTFRELVQRLRPLLLDALANADLPFGKIVDAVNPPRDPSRTPLGQMTFSLNNVSAPISLPGAEVSVVMPPIKTARLDMTWNLPDVPEGSQYEGLIGIEYNTNLFDEASVRSHVTHFAEVLGNVTRSPDVPISEVEMLTADERAELLRFGSGPMRPVRETTIVSVLEEQVRRAPEAIALVASGQEFTYAELNARANQLATVLREHGAAAGQTVGLCLHRNADLTVAMLGTLKAGAAYVPLDPANPPARLAALAADADVTCLLTHSDLVTTLAEVKAPVLALDAMAAELAGRPADNPPTAAGPTDVAYVIYTSGSTGMPKGVLIENRSVVNFADSTRDLFELTPADRILGFASATFDVSVFETFAALLNGARLHLLSEEERLSIDKLQAVIETAGITVTDLPPIVMTLLDPERFTDLRIVFVGGEEFSGELVNRWNPGRRLFNGYGPTECTVTMIVEECSGSWDSSPPIGLPMTNHVAHVLDNRGRLVPPGQPGELVIGGAGLARGYLGSPEQTAAKFISDPFGTAPGGRLYRTGDLVRRLPDGRLVFLGRVDQQVKIRGLRIELGEVESAMATFPGIGQVCAQPWTDENDERHLVGYLTTGGGSGSARPDIDQLRVHLATVLPVYMVPSFFVVLDQMPVNSSGKVEKRQLPAPDKTIAKAEGQRQGEPTTATERVLLTEILVPLLGNESVGIYDDFFRAGGNSLQAAQLMSALNRRFTVEVALADFFVSPTVAHLASVIDAKQAEQMSDEELLDMLENMSEDQVSSLLDDAGTGL